MLATSSRYVGSSAGGMPSTSANSIDELLGVEVARPAVALARQGSAVDQQVLERELAGPEPVAPAPVGGLEDVARTVASTGLDDAARG